VLRILVLGLSDFSGLGPRLRQQNSLGIKNFQMKRSFDVTNKTSIFRVYNILISDFTTSAGNITPPNII
jgi:hypothetical protein